MLDAAASVLLAVIERLLELLVVLAFEAVIP